MSDQDLLVQLRQNSHEAFDDIFRAHYAHLVGFANSILQDRAVAEDVAQDVMVELWRRRATINVETSLKAYLFRAARNRALNQVRHDRVAKREEGTVAAGMPTVPHADRITLEAALDSALSDALQDLPPRCREVFVLSRQHAMTYAEVANALGISVKTVEAQMGKALRILRDRLAPWLQKE